jgi:hypothetical protein
MQRPTLKELHFLSPNGFNSFRVGLNEMDTQGSSYLATLGYKMAILSGWLRAVFNLRLAFLKFCLGISQ